MKCAHCNCGFSALKDDGNSKGSGSAGAFIVDAAHLIMANYFGNFSAAGATNGAGWVGSIGVGIVGGY
eukprot:8611105-Ditylum_brightwellii.AAC.1